MKRVRIIWSGLHSDGDFNFFYPAAVGVQHGEFEVAARNDVVDLWNVPRYFEDEAGEAVAVPFYFIESIDGKIHGLANVVKHGPAFEDIAAVIHVAGFGLVFVEFVADVTDHLFQDIFERDDAAGTSKLI